MQVISDALDYLKVLFTQMISLTNILDIAIVAYIIYKCIQLVRVTRAGQLIKGLFVILIIYGLATVFKMKMLLFLIDRLSVYLVFILVVVFQPELRRALGQIGQSANSSYSGFSLFGRNREEQQEVIRKAIGAVTDAVIALKGMRMGALIVFERDTRLGDIIRTGISLQAAPSQQLISNIFFNKAPLHDGAMVIRDGMVCAAGCILPLSKNIGIDPDLGTRHRAAIGITEDSDALVIVVSEESGVISLARDGMLVRDFSRDALKASLEDSLLPKSDKDSFFRWILPRKEGRDARSKKQK